MSLEDFDRVLTTIPTLRIRKWYDEDVAMLFKILYWCALRPIEGIQRSKSDFNLNNRTVKLGNTKTKHNDYALIPTRFVQELEYYLDQKEEGRLLDGLTYHTFYRWLKRLGKLCDIEAWIMPQYESHEKTVGHIFRKSVAKAMVYGDIKDKNGEKFQIPIISKHLRHSKPSMTEDKYLKASRSQVAEIF